MRLHMHENLRQYYKQIMGYLIISLLSIYIIILTGKTYVKLLNDITNLVLSRYKDDFDDP
ncbi:MAG: hypothetical protein RXN78_06670 [Vulcanisaeta sp.]